MAVYCIVYIVYSIATAGTQTKGNYGPTIKCLVLALSTVKQATRVHSPAGGYRETKENKLGNWFKPIQTFEAKDEQLLSRELEPAAGWIVKTRSWS